MTSGKGRVSAALRERASRQAGYRCGYCLSSQELMGVPMTIEHLVPEILGGATVEENLWLRASDAISSKAHRRMQRIHIQANRWRCSTRDATGTPSSGSGSASDGQRDPRVAAITGTRAANAWPR